MKQYFEKMDPLGKALSPKQIDTMKDSIKQAEEIMRQLDAEAERIKKVGVPLETMHERGEMSVWERIDYLVDPGTFCPLHTIFDPDIAPGFPAFVMHSLVHDSTLGSKTVLIPDLFDVDKCTASRTI